MLDFVKGTPSYASSSTAAYTMNPQAARDTIAWRPMVAESLAQLVHHNFSAEYHFVNVKYKSGSQSRPYRFDNEEGKVVGTELQDWKKVLLTGLDGKMYECFEYTGKTTGKKWYTRELWT